MLDAVHKRCLRCLASAAVPRQLASSHESDSATNTTNDRHSDGTATCHTECQRPSAVFSAPTAPTVTGKPEAESRQWREMGSNITQLNSLISLVNVSSSLGNLKQINYY